MHLRFRLRSKRERGRPRWLLKWVRASPPARMGGPPLPPALEAGARAPIPVRSLSAGAAVAGAAPSPSARGSAGSGFGGRHFGPVNDEDHEAAQVRKNALAMFPIVPQRERLSLRKVYVSDGLVLPESDEHVDDLLADPSFMTVQCEAKPMLLTPALVDDPA